MLFTLLVTTLFTLKDSSCRFSFGRTIVTKSTKGLHLEKKKKKGICIFSNTY